MGTNNPILCGRDSCLESREDHGREESPASAIESDGESIFMSEWLASGRAPNLLPISAVCNSRCIFCSNHLNPFEIKKGVFRDIEDVKLQLSLMPIHSDPIRLSDSLPGRISEGEACLHPRFFDILRLIRRKFVTNTLCITTNGSMLDEPFLKELARFRPVEITQSMHSTRPDLWARIFGKTERDARTAIEAPALIKKYHMGLIGTIVPLPSVCGWDDIERTYGFFVRAGATSMIAYHPGVTVCTPPDRLDELRCTQDEFNTFAERMRNLHTTPLMAFPNLQETNLLPVRRIMANTTRGNLKTMGGPFRHVLWLTSEAAFPGIRGAVEQNAPDFPNHHTVVPVKNNVYGGNVVVSGLLMVDDFIATAKEALQERPDIDLVLAPKRPFDSLNRDLRRTPAYRISDVLERPVWLVDEKGNTDTLLNRVMTKSDFPDLRKLTELMRSFNEALLQQGPVEQALEMIDRFPVKFGDVVLDRENLAMLISEQGAACSPGGPVNCQFQVLDATRVLCIETWLTANRTSLCNRWVFLVKRDPNWRIESVTTGRAL